MYRIRMMVLTTLTLLLLFFNRSTYAGEALVMIGGDYLPGFLDNEVEVWSPSPSCDLSIPSTIDYFVDGPGVALFQNQIFVCGGSYIHGHPRDLCDVIGLTETQWKEGPSMSSELKGVKMVKKLEK